MSHHRIGCKCCGTESCVHTWTQTHTCSGRAWGAVTYQGVDCETGGTLNQWYKSGSTGTGSSSVCTYTYKKTVESPCPGEGCASSAVPDAPASQYGWVSGCCPNGCCRCGTGTGVGVCYPLEGLTAVNVNLHWEQRGWATQAECQSQAFSAGALIEQHIVSGISAGRSICNRWRLSNVTGHTYLSGGTLSTPPTLYSPPTMGVDVTVNCPTYDWTVALSYPTGFPNPRTSNFLGSNLGDPDGFTYAETNACGLGAFWTRYSITASATIEGITPGMCAILGTSSCTYNPFP